MNKKERKKVIRLLLTHYYKNGDILFLNGGDLEKVSTKEGVEVLKKIGVKPGEEKILWVYDRNLESHEESPYNLNLSLRNVDKVKLLPWDRMNALDLVYTDKIVINKGALEKINLTWGR
jgi:ribosomal protein L4